MADSSINAEQPSSVNEAFAEQAAKPAPELNDEFRSAHIVPIMNSQFRKEAKAENRFKDLSKPAPTLTPEGTTTTRKEMPTSAEKDIDPARLPKMVKQRQQPHQEFTHQVGRHRQQEQQNERER